VQSAQKGFCDDHHRHAQPYARQDVSVDALRRGAVSRAFRCGRWSVGGKGVNVSRQLRVLGERDRRKPGFIGGEIGSLLERLLDAEGISQRFVRIEGMTREGSRYPGPEGTMTSVFEAVSSGDSWPKAGRLLEECRALAGKSDWVVCSGSSPSPAATMFFGASSPIAVPRGNPRGSRLVRQRARAGRWSPFPIFMKPNREEFEQTFGTRLSGRSPDLIAAARRLVARGVRYSLITDGGGVLSRQADAGGAWIVTPRAW